MKIIYILSIAIVAASCKDNKATHKQIKNIDTTFDVWAADSSNVVTYYISDGDTAVSGAVRE